MNQQQNQLPRRNFPLGRLLGRATLRLFGWRIEGPLPQLAKCVMVVAPHTSNWDFVIGMAAALAMDLDANWLGKHSLFCRPFAPLLLWLGGIPVDRRQPQGVIEQVVAACREREHFLLGISPEGTRRPVARWKSGCHHIASSAGIPMVPVLLDFPRKRIHISEPWFAEATAEQTMTRLSKLFTAEMGKLPHNFAPHSSKEQ